MGRNLDSLQATRGKRGTCESDDKMRAVRRAGNFWVGRCRCWFEPTVGVGVDFSVGVGAQH